jgi:hypothetical protein
LEAEEALLLIRERKRLLQEEILDAQVDSAVGRSIISNICSM